MLEKSKRYDTVYICKIDDGYMAYCQFGLTEDQALKIAEKGELLLFDYVGYPTWVIFDLQDFFVQAVRLQDMIEIAKRVGFLGSKDAKFIGFRG